MVKFKKRLRTEHIVVHCSATKPSKNIGVRDIRLWHKSNGWLDVGYHYIIRRNGVIEEGRSHESIGAHAKGINDKSVGICLVGGCSEETGAPEANYTEEQMQALLVLLTRLTTVEYPDAKVIGHRDVDSSKECPCFDVSTWFSSVSELVGSLM